MLDPEKDSIATVAGSTAAGFADGAGLGARLSEPGGLAPAGPSSLFIADTNNSVIRCVFWFQRLLGVAVLLLTLTVCGPQEYKVVLR